jgi:DNA mismatch repair protein MSH5
MQEGLPYLRGLVKVIFIPQVGCAARLRLATAILYYIQLTLVLLFYTPQVGFLVALTEHHSWRLDGKLPEDFKYIFTQDDFCYFKNPDVSALDDSIGDLDSSIKDTELLLVAELEDDILECENELRETFNALADLDCILAFASCADDLKYVRPDVVPAEENCINITNGRHPLQEIIIDGDFIPNHTATNATDRVNIVTGPNFSGKSCYARQVGLIVYMAHIGSFVPCDSARLSVTEQILARFSSVETCAVPQSSFQLDLSQMGSILRRSSSTSLVLIDEFGKGKSHGVYRERITLKHLTLFFMLTGTSPASGIALLTAALQKLATTQCKAICTTHFLEIFSMELLRDGENGIKALRMAVQVPKTTEEIPAPLFKLEEGVASSSAGLVCAKMAGVKNAVIERATEIVQAVKDRRQVKPLPEILRSTLGLSPLTKDALGQFISTDWTGASDDELNHFLSKVDQM